MKNRMSIYVIGVFALCFSSISYSSVSFEQYVAGLTLQAKKQGFSDEFLTDALRDIKQLKRAVKADKNQPEVRLTLDKYLATRVPQWKVDKAVALYQENKAILSNVEAEYGVQARFIVALWGNESNFGKIQGRYPVLSALASLAYDGRREALFKKQFFAALTILQQGHIDKSSFLGSWAGAMGQTQFMPTSFLNYAVDYDGDGKKDIWTNKADAFASIANYLKSEGWNNSLTWGRQVKIAKDFDVKLAGLSRSKQKKLASWQALGVTRYDGSPLPNADIMASLIMPDDEKGRIYLVYENFHTLMKWNRSTYFGTAVSYLADKIKFGAVNVSTP